MRFSKLILFTLISLLITDTFHILAANEMLNIGYSTYIRAIIIYISVLIIIFIAVKTKKQGANIPLSIQRLFSFWLIWNIIEIILGAFLAANYWNWKFLLLDSIPFAMVALVFFIGENSLFPKIIFRFTLKYVFPFGFLIIPLALTTNEELYPRLMIFVSVFILFIPYLKNKWKLLVLIVAATSIIIAMGFRTNLVKIFLSFMILFVYYFNFFFTKNILKLIHLFIFILPIILFALAISGNFNVFYELSKNNEYTTTRKTGKVESLTSDSRTFLYVEILNQLVHSGNWLIGESASRGYHSIAFYNDGGAIKGQRNNSEVGILNIILHFGIIGVILYLLLLYTVSYIAINSSNNILSKMLGLLIASRWMLSFIEEFSQYDLNFYFFWLIIGVVSTSSFRMMNEQEVKSYFKEL